MSYIDTTALQLRDHPFYLSTSLYYACQSRFDYWLRHLPSSITAVHADGVDDAIVRASTTLGAPGMFDDDLLLRRLRLASRMRGGGYRSRRWLAPIAWCSGFIEASERMIDQHAVGGGVTRRGCFPVLTRLFGGGAFDQTSGHRFRLHNFAWICENTPFRGTTRRGGARIGKSAAGPNRDN